MPSNRFENRLPNLLTIDPVPENASPIFAANVCTIPITSLAVSPIPENSFDMKSVPVCLPENPSRINSTSTETVAVTTVTAFRAASPTLTKNPSDATAVPLNPLTTSASPAVIAFRVVPANSPPFSMAPPNSDDKAEATVVSPSTRIGIADLARRSKVSKTPLSLSPSFAPTSDSSPPTDSFNWSRLDRASGDLATSIPRAPPMPAIASPAMPRGEARDRSPTRSRPRTSIEPLAATIAASPAATPRRPARATAHTPEPDDRLLIRSEKKTAMRRAAGPITRPIAMATVSMEELRASSPPRHPAFFAAASLAATPPFSTSAEKSFSSFSFSDFNTSAAREASVPKILEIASAFCSSVPKLFSPSRRILITSANLRVFPALSNRTDPVTPAFDARSDRKAFASFDLPPRNWMAVFSEVPASEPRMPFFANAARTAFMFSKDCNPPSTFLNVFENENPACCKASASSDADDPLRIDANASESATFTVSFAPMSNTFTPADTALAAVSASTSRARDRASTAFPAPPSVVSTFTPDTDSTRNASAASFADTPGSFTSLPRSIASLSRRFIWSAVGLIATCNTAIAPVKSDATFNVFNRPAPNPSPPATGSNPERALWPVAAPRTPVDVLVWRLCVRCAAARSRASRLNRLRRKTDPCFSMLLISVLVRRNPRMRLLFAELSSSPNLRAHFPIVDAISRPPDDATAVSVL